ncbi:MAG TPA: serine hydrolase domain-containing protein [Gemmatimonadales bacterium]|nr:serine hydrolase domain-containing protein [Gemmatimonadales bacterium]
MLASRADLSAQAPYPSTIAYLDSAIASGAAPGAVLGISYRGDWYVHGTGRIGIGDSTRPNGATVYDLASLTKVIGLTTALMMAVDSGIIALDSPVQRYVPAFVGRNKSRVTVRMLLVHAGGLPDWRPLYKETTTRLEAFALADTTPLDTLPGTRFKYSDLGAIVLTQAVEAVYHERLDSLLARQVFTPLGMTSSRYLPPDSWLGRIAPTENDPWRGRILRGEVHDENAARLDGVSGHAGLFSTTTDLLHFGDWLLAASRSGSVTPEISARTVAAFLTIQNIPAGSSRALGWDTPPGPGSGPLLSPTSFGHTGFTGTSIWIDPSRELVIVLLTNRVHPSRENNRMGPVRRGVADRVIRDLGTTSREDGRR